MQGTQTEKVKKMPALLKLHMLPGMKKCNSKETSTVQYSIAYIRDGKKQDLKKENQVHDRKLEYDDRNFKYRQRKDTKIFTNQAKISCTVNKDGKY